MTRMHRTSNAVVGSGWRDDRGRARLVAEHGDEGLFDQVGEVLPLLRRGGVDPQGEVGAGDVLPAQRLQLVHRRRPQLTVTAEVLVADGLAEQRGLALDPADLDPEVRVPGRMDDKRVVAASGDA